MSFTWFLFCSPSLLLWLTRTSQMARSVTPRRSEVQVQLEKMEANGYVGSFLGSYLSQSASIMMTSTDKWQAYVQASRHWRDCLVWICFHINTLRLACLDLADNNFRHWERSSIQWTQSTCTPPTLLDPYPWTLFRTQLYNLNEDSKFTEW